MFFFICLYTLAAMKLPVYSADSWNRMQSLSLAACLYYC